ncbi:unnamed protein product [Effrenium voratum]|uniref:Protein kinase domain-containing protein n=1 Tax=Effrenium voratum TaxID=2562239 RepID=A0AA36J0T0_9DINO|nr:unnamed protein product [Effrenium voratum]
MEALTVGEEIGKGRFKTVNRGVLKAYAVNDGDNSDRDIVVIRYAKGNAENSNELQVLNRLALLSHTAENIPKVYGAAEQGRDLVLVQELAAFGCLKSVVSDPHELWTPQHGLHTARQICSGMHALEVARVAHADLACRNILVKHMGADPASICVKVTDFGLSVMIDEGMDHKIRKQPSATRWVSPETVALQKLSLRADVWSTGAMLWEIFANGNVPWVNWPKRVPLAEKLRAMVEKPNSEEAAFDPRAEFPAQEGYPEEAHEALLSCLQVDEYARPKFNDLANRYEEVILEASRGEAASPEATDETTSPLSLASEDASTEAKTPRTPKLLGREADQGAIRKGQVGLSQDVLTLITQQKEMLELLHEEFKEIRSQSAPRSRISSVGTPQREQLIPLEDGKPVKPAHVMAMTGTPGAWTLRSLVGPDLMKKQEFKEKDDAWQAFIYCSDTNQPCSLLDPSGETRASSGWTDASQFERVQQAVLEGFAAPKEGQAPGAYGHQGYATPPAPVFAMSAPQLPQLLSSMPQSMSMKQLPSQLPAFMSPQLTPTLSTRQLPAFMSPPHEPRVIRG